MTQQVITSLAWQAATTFIRYIFHPQATDDTDEIVCIKQGGIPGGYDSQGHFICLYEPTPPPPETPLTQPIPRVSEPPKNIYYDQPTTIDITYPELPERRLSNTKLPVGGGRSVSVLKKVITVSNAIKNANYGHLLHEPITNSPVAFQVCKNADYGKALEEKQKLAAQKFFDTLTIADPSDSTPELPQPSYSMSEQSVTLVSGTDYTVGALFGIEGINDFISSFLSRNFIPNLPITGTIPLNYEYIDCTHGETQVNELLENLTVVNIQEYLESLGLNNVSNQLNSLSTKINTSTELEYLYNQLISASAKTSLVDLVASGTEYLHNQMVSLSAKTAVIAPSEVVGTEYLNNQLVSLSTKTLDKAQAPGAEYLHNQMVSLSAKTAAIASSEVVGTEYLHNQLVSLSAKASTQAGITALRQEYLYNQMVSLSAKTAAIASSEVIGTEYLNNQLVSLSAKTLDKAQAPGAEYLHNQMVSLSAKTAAIASSEVGIEYLSNKLVSLLAKSKTTDSPEVIGIEYLYNQSISFSIKNYSADINKLLEITGMDDFPITVPETLISKFADNSTNPVPIKEKQLTSIPQMFHWYVERFDEIMGQWSVPIEIKDIDPTTPGDQSKLMVFPNMAELLAEMMMIMFQVSINSELLTNLTTRILMEAGQDKQQNLITYKLLQSLTDYIGYSYKDEIVEMPLLFDPNAKSFDKMLTEVQVKVPVAEFNEKFNLQADFMRFRKAASILDSAYFKKVDPSGDIKAQLMKRLFDLRDFLKEANKEDESFKEFLKQVEAGFTGTPGVGDPTRPYGNEYEDRPRFRDFNSEGIPDDI